MSPIPSSWVGEGPGAFGVLDPQLFARTLRSGRIVSMKVAVVALALALLTDWRWPKTFALSIHPIRLTAPSAELAHPPANASDMIDKANPGRLLRDQPTGVAAGPSPRVCSSGDTLLQSGCRDAIRH